MAFVPEGRPKSLSVPVLAESVQSSRWDGAIFLVIPGLATIGPSGTKPIDTEILQSAILSPLA
jgi:hypothetical protein